MAAPGPKPAEDADLAMAEPPKAPPVQIPDMPWKKKKT
jgi:hypothetical protein